MKRQHPATVAITPLAHRAKRFQKRTAYDPCIRDDSTECDCPRCIAFEDAFWREQGERR